uniref:Uncharacterized protein n=1 Tax=Rhizophora mucronata TaxID=61149 RepID=A0A2P2MLJ2_RHIMU
MVSHVCDSQENSKTKHPQLLYEAKLYNILQGGSTYQNFNNFVVFFYLGS